MMSIKNDESNPSAAKSSNAHLHGADVENLINQYDHGLKKYHEINHHSSIHEARSRWPLLKEISNSAADIKKQI